MVFLACSIDSISRTKSVQLFVALITRCSLTVQAHSRNGANNFQGSTARLADMSFVGHDLPLESGDGIKEVTGKRRAQNLGQLPDHTGFACRSTCSPVLAKPQVLLTVGQGNFQRFSLCRRESVRQRSLEQHSSTKHLPNP